MSENNGRWIQIDDIVDRVNTSSCWHEHGSLSERVLCAMARHVSCLDVKCSVETGCGKSTMLIAQFSQNHIAFTADSDEILAKAKESPLIKDRNVRFVAGPTQKTLPVHEFAEPIQVILLDGPHAYPFPEIEYYFLYPHIEKGGLLILDDVDIHLPCATCSGFLRAMRCSHIWRQWAQLHF